MSDSYNGRNGPAITRRASRTRARKAKRRQPYIPLDGDALLASLTAEFNRGTSQEPREAAYTVRT